MNQAHHPWLRPILGILLLLIVIGVVLARYGSEPERRLFALNASDGKVAWSSPIDQNWNPYSRLTADQGRVFVATSDNRQQASHRHWQITAYDTSSGKTDWTYAPFGSRGTPDLCLSMVSSGPIVADGQVYSWVCAGPEGDGSTAFDKAAIVALDEATGQVLWEHDAPETPRVMALGSPLPLRVIGDSAYVLTATEQSQWALDVIDVKNGKTRRQIALPDLDGREPTDLPVSAIQADEQTLYLNVAKLMAINPSDGKVLFALDVGQTPWLADRGGISGNVRANRTESLTSYSPVDGSILWQKVFDKNLLPGQAADGEIDLSMQMSADNRNVYVYGVDRRHYQVWMVAARRDDGVIAWTKPLENQRLFSDILMRPSSNSRVVAYLDGNEIQAADTTSGTLLWSFRAESSDTSPVMDDQHVYLLDESPRYRHWLASLNPAWH